MCYTIPIRHSCKCEIEVSLACTESVEADDSGCYPTRKLPGVKISSPCEDHKGKPLSSEDFKEIYDAAVMFCGRAAPYGGDLYFENGQMVIF
jgi:hypothetical protein